MTTSAQLRTAYTVANTVTGGDLLVEDMGVLLGTKGCFTLQQALPTTSAAAGTSLLWLKAPFAFTVDSVKASHVAAGTTAASLIDINDGGTTILSTKLMIDANELTSTTATTAYVLSDTAIAADAIITVDVDSNGTSAAGLQVDIFYTRTA